jgi:lysine biosynthesis protein LysW
VSIARAINDLIVKEFARTPDVSVDLNVLLQQLKEGGLILVYRCPHCGGKLKIDKNVDIAELKQCEHCGSEIESVDLADFLKTALS